MKTLLASFLFLLMPNLFLFGQSKSTILNEIKQKKLSFQSIYRKVSGEKITFYQLKNNFLIEYDNIEVDRKNSRSYQISKILDKEGYILLIGFNYKFNKPEFIDYHEFWGQGYNSGYCDLEADYVFISKIDISSLSRIKKTDEVLKLAYNDIFQNRYPTASQILQEHPNFQKELYDYYHDRYETKCGSLKSPNTNCHKLKIKINDVFGTYVNTISQSKQRVEEYNQVIEDYAIGVGKAIIGQEKPLSSSSNSKSDSDPTLRPSLESAPIPSYEVVNCVEGKANEGGISIQGGYTLCLVKYGDGSRGYVYAGKTSRDWFFIKNNSNNGQKYYYSNRESTINALYLQIKYGIISGRNYCQSCGN